MIVETKDKILKELKDRTDNILDDLGYHTNEAKNLYVILNTI